MLARVEPHPWARAFAGVAEAYERARPGYPPAARAWLAGRLGLGPGRTVVDVGAGTGKLTRLLLETGADVVAVEPLDELRAFVRRLDGVRALAGTAEALPLPDGCADAVVAGQAFHWFRGVEALAEFHRVLRPGGALGLLWNRLDRGDPFTDAFAALLERRRAHPARDGGEWRAALDAFPGFAAPETGAFAHAQEVDADVLADRLASESSIAVLPEPERRAARDEARALAPEAGLLRYVTLGYASRRL